MRRAAAFLAASWLALAPAAAEANGALLIQPAGAASLTPGGGPAATVNQIVANSGVSTGPQVTFGSSPPVGDWIIFVDVDGGYGHTPSAGWIVLAVVSNCASGPEKVVFYHQVQIGDGATFKPSATAQNFGWVAAAMDLTTSLPTWAAIYEGLSANCAASTGVSVSPPGASPNSIIFGIGEVSVPTSGSLSADPTMTGVTAAAQATHINPGTGQSDGIVAAYAVVPSGGPPAAAVAGTGVNISQTTAIEIAFNPQ
jgi:hypothetical protein